MRYSECVQDLIADLASAAQAYGAAVEMAERRRTERDAVIVAAFKAGVPIRVIAATVGLTASRVSDLLGRPMGRPGRPRQHTSHSPLLGLPTTPDMVQSP